MLLLTSWTTSKVTASICHHRMHRRSLGAAIVPPPCAVDCIRKTTKKFVGGHLRGVTVVLQWLCRVQVLIRERPRRTATATMVEAAKPFAVGAQPEEQAPESGGKRTVLVAVDNSPVSGRLRPCAHGCPPLDFLHPPFWRLHQRTAPSLIFGCPHPWPFGLHKLTDPWLDLQASERACQWAMKNLVRPGELFTTTASWAHHCISAHSLVTCYRRSLFGCVTCVTHPSTLLLLHGACRIAWSLLRVQA